MNNTKTENLIVNQGENLTVEFEFPDLSNFVSARMQVRKGYNDENVLFTLGDVRNTVQIDGNTLRLLFIPDVTNAVEFSGRVLDAVYDLELTNSDGTVFIALRGTFELVRNVTRSGVVIQPEDLNLDNDESLVGFVTKIDTGVYTTREVLIDSVTEGLSIENANGVLGNTIITFDIDPIIKDLTDQIVSNDNDIAALVAEQLVQDQTVADLDTDFTDFKNTQENTNAEINDSIDTVQTNLDEFEAAQTQTNSEINSAISDVQTNLDEYETSNDAVIADFKAAQAVVDSNLADDIAQTATNATDALTAFSDAQSIADQEADDRLSAVVAAQAITNADRFVETQTVQKNLDDFEASNAAERVSDLEAQSITDTAQDAANALVQANLDDYETANDARFDALDAARVVEAGDLDTYKQELVDLMAEEAVALSTYKTETADQRTVDLQAQAALDDAQDAAIKLVQTNLDVYEVDNNLRLDELDDVRVVEAGALQEYKDATEIQRLSDLNDQNVANTLVQTNLDDYETSNDARFDSLDAARVVEATELDAYKVAVAEQRDADTDAQQVLNADQDADIAQVQTNLGQYEASNDVALAAERARIDSNDVDIATLNDQQVAQDQVTADLDAQNVKLTGDQLITGQKTFDMVDGEALTVLGNVNITGEFAVTGNVSYKNVEQLDIGDNKIVLNSDEEGVPSENSGVEIQRGTETNAVIQWNEGVDRWEAGLDGSLRELAYAEDLTNTNIALTNDLSVVNQALVTEQDSRIAADDVERLARTATDDALLEQITDLTSDFAAHTHLKADITDFNEGDYVSSFGDSMTGNLSIFNTNAAANLTLGSVNVGNSQINFRSGDLAVGQVLGGETELRLTHVHRTGGSNTLLQLLDEGITSNKPLLTSALTDSGSASNSLTTKDYVDNELDGKLNISGGNLTGNFGILNSAGSATLTLEPTGTSGNGQVVFRRGNGIESGVLSLSTRLLLRRNSITPGEGNTDMSLFDTHATFNKEFRSSIAITDQSHTLAFTTRNYVDNEIDRIGLIDGVTTNPLVISPAAPTPAQLTLDNNAGGNGNILFKTGGDDIGHIDGNANRIRMRHEPSADGIATDLVLFDTFVTINKEMRGIPTADNSHSSSFVTKSYFDANTSSEFDGGTISGQLKIAPSLGTAARLTLDDNSGANSGVVFEEVGAIVGSMDANSSRVLIHHRAQDDTDTDTNLVLSTTHINSNKEIRVPAITASTNALAAVNKQYVDSLNTGGGSDFASTGGDVTAEVDFQENVGVDKILNVYDEVRYHEPDGGTVNYTAFKQPNGTTRNTTVLWPTNVAAVGDGLRVKSITGDTIALEWG